MEFFIIKKQKALSLPEMLVAMLLISTLFLFGVIFATSFSQTKKQKNYEVAIALAQQAIEAIKSTPFEIIDDSDFGNDSFESDLNKNNGKFDLFESELVIDGVKYTRKVEIKNVPLSNYPNVKSQLKAVKVTIKREAPNEYSVEPLVITTAIANIN